MGHHFVFPYTSDADLTVVFGADAAVLKIADATTTDAETPTVYGTLVGNELNGTGWWSAFSDYYSVAANETKTVYFKNYSSKIANAYNWLLVLTNNADRGNNTEYLVLRSDHFGWGSKYSSGTLTSNYNWDTFRDELDDATVKMNVTRDGGTVTVTATQIAATDGTTVRTETFTFTDNDLASEAMRFFLTTEGGHLDILPECTITLTRNNNDYGTASITATAFNDGVVPAGTSVTVTATPADGYVFNGWKSGEEYVSRNSTYTFTATADATLQAEFLDVTTYNTNVITSNKGDITSLINGDFTDNADGWESQAEGGSIVYQANQTYTNQNWKDNGENPYIELASTGAMMCTLSNMPAGTYKVVAAARADVNGVIQAEIANTTGTSMTGTGNYKGASTTEINTNGVEMPYSNLGGFTTNDWGHNWHWITATGTLASAGELVIKFNCTGSSWMAIDDVHLYCTNLGETSYTTSLNNINGNTEVANTGNASVVTCDITVTNPNAVFKSTSGAAIATAAGDLNNCLYETSSGWYMTGMVLYDGYNYEEYDVVHSNTHQYWATTGTKYYTCTLYREIPADTWCSLVIPFWPNTSLTKKYPSSFSDGTLIFSDVTSSSCWNDEPMLIKSASALTKIQGTRGGSGAGGSGVTYGDMISGAGVPMTGVYTSGSVPQSTETIYYYALGDDNNLHKVTGGSVTINPFRAYFKLDNSAVGEAPARISLNFDDESTGIGSVKSEEVKAKSYFNLSGQRVTAPQKGLYIVNGKKVIIK